MIENNVCSPAKWLDFASQYVDVDEIKDKKWSWLSSFINDLSLFNILAGMNGQGKGVRNLSLYYVPDMCNSKNRTWLCHIKLFRQEPQSKKYQFEELLKITFLHRIYNNTFSNKQFEEIFVEHMKMNVSKTVSQIYTSLEFNIGFKILKVSIDQYIETISQTTAKD